MWHNRNWKKAGSVILAVCLIAALLLSNQSFGVFAEEEQSQAVTQEEVQPEFIADETSQDIEESVSFEETETDDEDNADVDVDIESTPEDEVYFEEDSEADVEPAQEEENETDEGDISTFSDLEDENEIVFDLSKGKVIFRADNTYVGKDIGGKELYGNHLDSNIYRIMQSDSISTTNTITIETGNLYGNGINAVNENSTYNIILDNVNIDCSTQEGAPDGTMCEGVITESKYYRTLAQQLNYYQNERISSPFIAGDDTVSVNVTLRGKNYLYAQNGAGATLQYAHYPMGKTGTGKLTLKGNGELVVRQTENDTSVNRGACIGGPMLYYAESKNGRAGNGEIVFEGGTILAETNSRSYSAAIGGGSCSPSEMPIVFAGSTITVKSFNTSATIGAGGGSTGIGEAAHDIEIKSGEITVYSPDKGVGIGGGTSQQRSGGDAKNISILGGKVNVYGPDQDSYGRIGGGTSKNIGVEKEERNGGAANITILGGTIIAGSIGGGSTNAPEANGGNATIIVGGDAQITTESIGGGESDSGFGGNATVIVQGGTLNVTDTIGGGYSKIGKGGDASIYVTGGTLKCASIGGGNSDSGTPGAVSGTDSQSAGIVVTGGTVQTGTIGGGKNTNGAIGFATADISGGDIQGQFILSNTDASKKCTFTMSGGTIDNTALWSDTANSRYQMAQKNGGAVYLTDEKGEVNISGGTIQNCRAELGGAVYMTAGTVNLSGTGKILNCAATGDADSNIEAQGGAIYLKDGTVNVSGGEISGCSALNGAAVYMQGGSMSVSGGSIKTNTATKSGGGAYLAAGNLDISGGNFTENTAPKGAGAYLAGGSLTVQGGEIAQNTATKSGGGAYLAAGNFDISGGKFTENKAPNGAGAYLAGGNLNVSGSGTFNLNKASENGGAAYLANGTLTLDGGTVSTNTATNNGGGFYVADGAVRMFGGNITGNHAEQDGGGFYVSSAENAANVVIRSGSITDNTSGGSGAGMAVVGGENAKADTVILGLMEEHKDLKITDTSRSFTPFDYTDTVDRTKHNHASCPVLQGNTADGDGGGIYMQSTAAILNIYCLEERGNISKANTNGNGVMMAGGNLVIGDEQHNDKNAWGNTDIGSPMLVEGGSVDIWGSMDNPLFEKNILVDIQAGAGHFEDHRKQAEDKNRYKIQYFENFTAGGTQTASGMYIASQYDVEDKIYADGTLFKHDGWRILGWATAEVNESNKNNNTNQVSYSIGAFIGGLTGENTYDHTAWKNGDTEPLVLYAVWDRSIYTVKFWPNANQYEGSMADQTFSYAVEQSLSPNQYKVTGKRFTGWKDNNGTDYAADYSESTMTLTNEGTVDLYAQWVDCTHRDGEHPGTLSYTIDTETNTIIETCDCEGHTASIGLVGPNGTIYHDGNAHPATITHPKGTLLADTSTIKYKSCTTENGTYSEMTAGEVPTEEGFYEASITVEGKTISVRYQIRSASSTVSVDAECIDGQQFGPFNGSATCRIAKDDAFTVWYSVRNLNNNYLMEPSLVMDQSLPAGTTIIMQIKNADAYSYWYKNIEKETKEIALDAFSKMGETVDQSFLYQFSSTQEYRFVFDFSKVTEVNQLSEILETKLVYKHNSSSETDSVVGSAKVTLDDKGTFSLSGTAESLQIKAPQDKSYSRWDKKNLVLVITAKDGKQFPSDAKLTVESGGKTYSYSKDVGDKFVVPIAWTTQGTVKMYLNSDLLSAEKGYPVYVKLCVGDEVENSNNQPRAEEYETGAQVTDISLSVSDTATPSLRIEGTQKVLKNSDKLNLNIKTQGTDNCTIHATIQQKETSGYGGDFLSANVKSDNNQFSLGGIKAPGSYRLLITVTRNNQAVLTVPYYFIVQ